MGAVNEDNTRTGHTILRSTSTLICTCYGSGKKGGIGKEGNEVTKKAVASADGHRK